jgi:hypothetical protein
MCSTAGLVISGVEFSDFVTIELLKLKISLTNDTQKQICEYVNPVRTLQVPTPVRFSGCLTHETARENVESKLRI